MAEATIAHQITRLRQRHSAPLILELDLTQGIVEGPPTDPLNAVLTRNRLRLGDMLDGLRRAREDDRVQALVAKVGGQNLGLATVQELREAIGKFRAAGKTAYAWAESFGEFGQGNGPYYLATAFDRIYLQPSGSLGLTGVVVERLFFRSALDKAGVSFEAGQRSEYKTAAHALTETGFTGPAREENEHLAAGVAGQLTSAIADRRGKTPDEARALLDRGPFLPQQALAEGLVDVLGYRDEAYAAIKQKAGQDAVLQYLTRYQRSANLAQRARKLPNPRERYVAVVYATGPIRMGRSGRGPMSGPWMGSDTIAAALRSAAADERAARSCSGSTARVVRPPRPTRSGVRSSGPGPAARRSWSPWATWPHPAVTTSRWPPTRSSSSPARSPARSVSSWASRCSRTCSAGPGSPPIG